MIKMGLTGQIIKTNKTGITKTESIRVITRICRYKNMKRSETKRLGAARVYQKVWKCSERGNSIDVNNGESNAMVMSWEVRRSFFSITPSD